MIASALRGMTRSSVSGRTLAAVVAVGLYGLYGLVNFAGTASGRGLNTWDVLMPAATDANAVEVIGLVWWLAWIVPVVSDAAHPARLVRFGSRARAVRVEAAFIAGCGVAFVALCTVVLLGEGMRVGLSLSWSETALSFRDGTPSAFDAPGFARFFANPVLAVVASTAYALVGFLIVSGVVLAVAVRGRTRAALVCLVVVASWMMICGFAPVPIPRPIDASFIVSLGWALATPGGLAIGLGWWGAGILVAAALIGRVHFARRTWSGRAFSMSVAAGVAVVCAVHVRALLTGSDSGLAAGFYAGVYGDVIGYALVAAIPLGFATAFLARQIDAADGRLTYEALRRGSYRRWLRRVLGREVAWALVLTVVVGFVLAMTMWATTVPTANDWRDLVRGSAGLLSETLLLTALASGLVWMTASPGTAWIVIAGLALSLGYWFPHDLPALNVLAPYSTPPDFSHPLNPLIATGVTLVAAIIVGTFAVGHATPKHADHTI